MFDGLGVIRRANSIHREPASPSAQPQQPPQPTMGGSTAGGVERASILADAPRGVQLAPLTLAPLTLAPPAVGGDGIGEIVSPTPTPLPDSGLLPSGGGGMGGDVEEAGNPLRRTLGVWDLTSLGIGGIIGAGVYVLTGTAAANYAGPAVIISFIISGVGCGFAALCYSELAAVMPVAGSAYSFAAATLGQFTGWFIGWDLILEYGMGASTVAVGWSAYTCSLLKDIGAPVPHAIAEAPFAYHPDTDTWSVTGGVINLPAVVVVLLMTVINVIGVRESARANNIIVGIKVVVLVLFILAGSAYVNRANWEPFVPPEKSPGVYGAGGIFRASAVVFFSYIGFDSISTAAQESRNPQRDLPIATIVSLVVCTGLYIATALVLTGLVSYEKLNTADPIAVAVDAAGDGLKWLRPIVKVGAILGLSSVVLVLLMGQARIFYAMAEDGMLPPVFSQVHPRYRTPVFTSIATGIVAALVAGLVPIDVLGEMVSIGTLFAFVVVCIGVIVLRRRNPGLHRPFRTPWVPWVPLAGAIISLLQMVALPGGTWLRFFVWLVLGVAIYWLYSRHHLRAHGARGAMMDVVRGSSGGAPPTPAADVLAGGSGGAVDGVGGSGGGGKSIPRSGSVNSYGTGTPTLRPSGAADGASPDDAEWRKAGAGATSGGDVGSFNPLRLAPPSLSEAAGANGGAPSRTVLPFPPVSGPSRASRARHAAHADGGGPSSDWTEESAAPATATSDTAALPPPPPAVTY